MAAWYSGRSSSLLKIFGQFGDDGSRDNSSVSWAEFYLYDEFTVTPCLTSDNASCSNVTSIDAISEYPYTVWQVGHGIHIINIMSHSRGGSIWGGGRWGRCPQFFKMPCSRPYILKRFTSVLSQQILEPPLLVSVLLSVP